MLFGLRPARIFNLFEGPLPPLEIGQLLLQPLHSNLDELPIFVPLLLALLLALNHFDDLGVSPRHSLELLFVSRPHGCHPLGHSPQFLQVVIVRVYRMLFNELGHFPSLLGAAQALREFFDLLSRRCEVSFGSSEDVAANVEFELFFFDELFPVPALGRQISYSLLKEVFAPQHRIVALLEPFFCFDGQFMFLYLISSVF